MVSEREIVRPLLKLRFQGPAIHDGRILYDDLSTFVSNISLAIDRILNNIMTGTDIKRGRPLKKAQLLSALEVVYVRKGSFGIGLALRRNGQQFPGWDLGEQATDTFMRGLNAMGQETPLPVEYGPGVMMALRDAGSIIAKGIDIVSLNSSSSIGDRKALYTLPVRERIISRLCTLERGYTAVEGRLTMMDADEEKLMCRIRSSTGQPIVCKYDEDITDQVWSHMRQFVQVRGEATWDSSTNKISFMHIKDLEPIEETASAGSTKLPVSAFWKGKTFDELAIEQGVYAISDVTKLSGDWPEEDDFDSFLDAVRSARN